MKLSELVEDVHHERAKRALTRAKEVEAAERDPILLTLLTGFAAWVASLFLLGFVILGLQPEETGFLILGAMLAALALMIHHKVERANVFVSQSNLSAMMCAHVMVLFGVLANFDRGDELLTLAVTQTALCALPLLAFRNPAYQLVSLLLAAGLWTGYAVEMNAPWLFRLLLAVEVTALGCGVLWRARRSSFTYALAIAIGGTLFFLDWVHSIAYMGAFEEPLWPTNLILSAFVAVTGAFLLNAEQRKTPTIVIAYILLLALAFLSSPGLLFAVAMLLLGYGLRDPIFSGLGLASLPLFIVYFYYSLEVTLLLKSGILLASGIICLLMALLAHRSARKEAA